MDGTVTFMYNAKAMLKNYDILLNLTLSNFYNAEKRCFTKNVNSNKPIRALHKYFAKLLKNICSLRYN